MGWKYIMVLNKIGGTKFLVPIIFPDGLVHSMVYAQARTIMPGWSHDGVAAVSAGTIEHIDVEGLGGGSETLHIKSRPNDSLIIKNYSYDHGILQDKYV